MAKLTKMSVFKEHNAKPETAMDKTTRIVREIVDGELEQRQVKNARLRKARMEREANTPREATSETHKTRPSRAVKKR